MEGLLAALIGALAIAATPLVPALRPVAKAAVKSGLAVADAATKGGMAVAGATMGVVAVAGQQLDNLVTSVRSGVGGGDEPGATEAAMESEVEESPAEAEPEQSAALAAEPVVAGEASEIEAPPAEAGQSGVADEMGERKDKPAAVKTASEGAEAVSASADGSALLAVDGIGPKVAVVLANAGITTLEQLAAMNEAQLREIIWAAGSRYRAMDPSTWPEQANRLIESSARSEYN